MGITDEALNDSDLGDFRPLVDKFYNFDNADNSSYLTGYIVLLFKNLVRFIGTDFAPLNAQELYDNISRSCMGQEIRGGVKALTLIDADDDSLIEFASRFSGEHLTENDDFTRDCINEFLNLHNGLFAVNLSNETGLEIELSPQLVYNDISIETIKNSHVIPVCFSFGTVNFIISI